jgi:Uma2 family endonuclease
MTIPAVQDFEQIVWPKDIIVPSGDLYSDEPELETYQHLQQLVYLLTSLEWWWRDRTDFFAAGNLTVYYSPRQRKSEYFRGPDFFVVLDTKRYPRKSWVVWEEDGKYPNVVIEVLSDSTADMDKGLKKQIYQDIWRTPYYFWIAPTGKDFQGFHLVDGHYEAIEPNEAGLLWCEALDLYLGTHDHKLRFFTPEGVLVPIPAESALQEAQRAEEERLRADAADRRAERLAAQLRSMGVEPDSNL